MSDPDQSKHNKADFRRGAQDVLPLALAVAVFGMVMGVTASTKPISFLEMVIMNSAVFAGSSQMVAIDIWASPLAVWEIIIATAVINLRYMLMCAALKPVLGPVPLWQKVLFIHPVADENWALTMGRLHKEGNITPYYLLGSGLCLMLFWQAGSMAGYGAGGGIPDPAVYGLDFAFTAAFLALSMTLYTGRSDILPWIVAAITATVGNQFLPGKWYVLVGALSGFAVGLLTYRPEDDQPIDELPEQNEEALADA